jgi:hypothetical protein
MAQTVTTPLRGFSKKPNRPGRCPRPLSPQALAAKLGANVSLYTRGRGDATNKGLLVPAELGNRRGESLALAGLSPGRRRPGRAL